MDEVGQVPNLVRRGAVYRCRMRCPQHLLREGVPVEKSVSLGTKERAIALERLPAARLELMEFFQGATKPPAVSSSGIVRSVQRARRPDHPDIPLLTAHEVEPLAKQFFAAVWAEMDLASADNVDLHDDDRKQREVELEDRLASLERGTMDAEDPALAVEIVVLRKAGRRSPYGSDPSRLLRGYLRRALTQVCRAELARLRGDYRDRISDRLFQPETGWRAGVDTSPAAPTTPKVLLRLVRETFERSELDADESITEKTRDKKKAALVLVERFFGADCDVSRRRGQI